MAETQRTDCSTGWAFPCTLGEEGNKKTPQDLDREVVSWPVLACELPDQVLLLLPCGLGKAVVLAGDALAKKISQGPHL